MSLTPPLNARPWAGRIAALLGIVLVALNLRTAVAALSPITAQISAQVPLSSVDLGILGTVPPVAFALSAIFGAIVARRVGLERLLVMAIVAMIVGHLARALSGNFGVLLVGSSLALIGAGIGNVLLPPLVKRYFPDRLGSTTSAYVTVMSIGSSVPALVAAPIADAAGAAGWRYSLAIWAVLAAVGIVPWLVVIVRDVLERKTAALADGDLADVPLPALRVRLWRSRIAWVMAATFSIPALNSYVMFAWLPQILVDTAGVSQVTAGALLALFGILGLPAALIMPLVTVRARRVSVVVFPTMAAFLLGYLGLLLAPSSAPVVWVVLLGVGAWLFPVCLTLINLRSRTHEGSVALSGMTQGFGYGIGAVGPLMVGILHSITGGWTVPIVVLLAVLAASLVPAALISRPGFVEDELSPQPQREL